ncbi:hypothetical protein QR680_018473 [Steinernema hermaphroditum]|uniref:Uncharacterized protein n=1 Tax=Steinernema hermaphroditum TaxID=289476 RepID=A0AA39HIX1_9BILA|nr:hypothetical protein QR680_018473 [Steinernema hermaphroditum]
MDAVPYKFVEDVVELSDCDTLQSIKEEFAQPIWKEVFDVYKRNRRDYRVWFRKIDGVFQCCFFSEKFTDMRRIQSIGHKFVRFVTLADQTSNNTVSGWDDLWDAGLKFEEGGIGKMIPILLPYYPLSRNSSSLSLHRSAPNLQNAKRYAQLMKKDEQDQEDWDDYYLKHDQLYSVAHCPVGHDDECVSIELSFQPCYHSTDSSYNEPKVEDLTEEDN